MHGSARLGKARQGHITHPEAGTMATKGIKVTIQGLSALLMHSFPMVPIEAIEKKSIEEQAELAAYRDTQTRELYVPGINVQRGLVAAAAYSKGKGRATLQKSAAACLLVSPERLGLGVNTYAIDSRPIVVPATKGRVLRHRPRLDAWRLTFEIEYDPTLLKPEEVRRIVDDMGSRVGLLDFRPEKKGPFGRFIVVEWM
jgi:hypothetical protein